MLYTRAAGGTAAGAAGDAAAVPASGTCARTRCGGCIEHGVPQRVPPRVPQRVRARQVNPVGHRKYLIRAAIATRQCRIYEG